jgi:para-nitrobenzyl esterase
VLLPALQPIRCVPTLVGFTADEGSALGRDYGSPDLAALQQLLASHYGVAAARFAPFYPASTAEERAESNRQLRRDSGAGSIYAWAERRGAGPPIFAYRWTHIEPGAQADHWLAFHSSEIPYVFQTLSASPERGFTSADRLLSRRISTYWLNFIRSGDPNGSELPAWPRLDLNDPRILEIGHRIGNRPLLPPDRMKAMRDFVAAGGNPSIF